MKLHVAIGIARNQTNHILIAKRPLHKPYSGYWELPGGKVEENESVFSALQREFYEELNIHVISANPWFQFTHHYPDQTVFLDIWKDIHFTGTPIGKEGQELRWISLGEVNQYQFPEGNKVILQKLISK